MTLTNRLFTFTVLASLGAAAHAQVAFNDFGSDANSAQFGYNTGSGWTLSGPASGAGEFDSGNQFTAGASGVVQDVIIGTNVASGAGNVDVMLMTDNANAIGSTVLESWSYTAGGTFGSWSAPTMLAGDGSASVVSGQNYWLVQVVSGAANSNLWNVWNWNEVGTSQLDAYNQGNGWNYQASTLGAFEVDVTAAPEPAPLLALSGGLALLLRRRARK